MSLLFNYYFGSTMYNSGNGNTTLTDQFTSGRTAANGTLRSGEESSAETSTPSAISDNYSVDSPYDGSGSSNNYGLNGGLGNNLATHSFIPDPNDNKSGKRRFYNSNLSSTLSNTSFTICCWFKVPSSGNNKRETIFASGKHNDNEVEFFQIALSNSQVSGNYHLILNCRATENEYFDISNENSIEDDKWRFVAVSYKYDATLANKEIKTYLFRPSNSTTTAEYTNTYTSTTGSANGYNRILSTYGFKFNTFKFGTNRQNKKYFRGNISASRGYNYVLSSSEITNIYQYNSLNASVAGDPHMKTLSGVFYKYDYLGNFRLLSNNHKDPSKRIVINGYSDYGEKKRWGTRQYIRKIYIFCCNKSILINTGFRGIPVSVIENNGIKYTETELSFNEDAEINCFDCRTDFKISEWDTDSVNNHIKETGHRILKPVRNSITIELTANNISFLVNITNINNYNLQPCRVNIEPLGKISNSFSGTLISRIYSIQSNIPDIKYIDSITKTENTNIQLPELEKPQGNINKRYN